MNERGNLTKELLSYILQKDSLNFHKRLSIQSLIIANCRPIFTICQHFYFTVGEVRRRTAVGNYLEKFEGTFPSGEFLNPFFMNPNLPLPIPALVFMSLVITFG